MARGRAPEGPWGGVIARNVATEAGRGWPAGLTLLTGDDLYHLDAAQKAIVGALVPDADPFALTVVADGRVSASELVGQAASFGMFAARRVVLLRDVSVLDGEPDALLRFAAEPPADGYLIVRAPKIDRKRKLHQALAAGRVFEFRKPASHPEQAEAARECAAIAAAAGVTLPGDAAAELAAMCDHDLLRVTSEVEKLRAWLGGSGGRIAGDDMRFLVADGSALTGWELADALSRRDAAAGLAAVRGYPDEPNHAIRTIGGLAWRARVSLEVKAGGGRGWAPRGVEDAARRYSIEEMLAWPAALLAADRALKSSRGGGARAVLETLVRRWTVAARPSTEAR